MKIIGIVTLSLAVWIAWIPTTEACGVKLTARGTLHPPTPESPDAKVYVVGGDLKARKMLYVLRKRGYRGYLIANATALPGTEDAIIAREEILADVRRRTSTPIVLEMKGYRHTLRTLERALARHANESP